MTIDEIKKLIEVVRDAGIQELEVHWGENWVRIRGDAATNHQIVAPVVLPVATTSGTPQALTSPAAPVEGPTAPHPPAAPREDERDAVVKSPIVGTYYDAPAPGAATFVKIGDRVEPKQVLCIIESMKLMNEIEAEIAGTLIAKHVENGRPVEYGESLFTIRPL